MRLVRTPEILLALALAWSGPVAAGDWLDQVEGLLAFESNARSAIMLLESLPLPERQTADCHWALARAYHAARMPGPAAEAAAVHAALTAGRIDCGRDLAEVRSWLERTGRTIFAQVLSQIASSQSRPSLKSYLVAIKCHPPLMAADSSGLNEALLTALEHGVRSRPDRHEYRYQLAGANYLFGRVEASVRAFEDYLAVETDAYRLWRARFWLSRVRWEIAATLEAEARDRVRTSATGVVAQAREPAGDDLQRAARPRHPEPGDDLARPATASSIPLRREKPDQATVTSEQR